MITPPFIMKTSRRGFTLVELLVAMGILVLIFGLLLQISNGVLMATHASQHKLEARAQARMALDALAQDMLCRINRFGGALLVNTTGAPRLALLVESRGYEADSRFVAVNYEHENGEIRQSFNTATWSTASLTSALVTHANTTTLSRGVLRFELMLTLSDGRTVPVREAGEWLSDTVDGKALPSGYHALNLDDASRTRVRAITVAIAVVSEHGYQQLVSGERLEEAADALPLPTLSHPYALELWQEALDTGALSSLPELAARSIQLAGMTYPLN